MEQPNSSAAGQECLTHSSLTTHSSTKILSQHIAKKISLLDSIVEGDVGMGPILEPAARHVSLHGLAIFRLEQGHGIRLDIQGREGKRTLAGKSNQVPIHEQKIKTGRI